MIIVRGNCIPYFEYYHLEMGLSKRAILADFYGKNAITSNEESIELVELSRIDSDQPSKIIPTKKNLEKKVFAKKVCTDEIEERQSSMVRVVEFLLRLFGSV